MLKPPRPVAAAAYLAAMLINPNNHALDGGPATSELEREAVTELGAILGLPADSLGHLTSSGTIANLKALWIARELRPDAAVVYGSNAHYTHVRACRLLGLTALQAPADASGHVDLDAIDALCARHRVGTVVLTAGTTGLGSVDHLDEALALREQHGVRLHVDAAYGGFFRLLGEDLAPRRRLAAIGEFDSVVVDPHEHGLQPYGCGAVLFRDPSVAALYTHDSPYTCFTSPGDVHLGQISLECSRAGAAAAALWLTLRAVDLVPILAAGAQAARDWAALIRGSSELRLHLEPELDILTFFPAQARSAAGTDAASAALVTAAMSADDPFFLSTLAVDGSDFASLHKDLGEASGSVRVLRSVLMKPEHERWVAWLHERSCAAARQ